MNKQDYIQLIASLVVFYQIQHAVLTDLPIQPEAEAVKTILPENLEKNKKQSYRRWC